jgi:hypothetical protein
LDSFGFLSPDKVKTNQKQIPHTCFVGPNGRLELVRDDNVSKKRILDCAARQVAQGAALGECDFIPKSAIFVARVRYNRPFRDLDFERSLSRHSAGAACRAKYNRRDAAFRACLGCARSENVTLFQEVRFLSRNAILFMFEFPAKSKK